MNQRTNQENAAAHHIAAPPERCIVYVDGFNLYWGLRTGSLRHFYWLDIVALAKSFCRPHQQVVDAKYFTARVSGARIDDTGSRRTELNGKRERQSVYLGALSAHGGVKIIEGQYRSEPKKCFNCGRTWLDQEEKMTDVNIATTMLVDAYDDKYDTAFLICGDSDLTPPVREIARLFPAKKVVVWFPPNRKSWELKGAAKGAKDIEESHLRNQLPESVVKGSRTFTRPSKWRAPLSS